MDELIFAAMGFRSRCFHRFGSRGTRGWLFVSLLFALVIANEPVAAGASNPTADPRLTQAVTWATQELSAPKTWIEDGATLCDKFVENAFGVTAQYPTAYDMYLALGKSSDPTQHTVASLQNAPPGVIVFFDRNAGNGYNGHVGIYLGQGLFIGVVTGGGVSQHGVQWWNDHVSHFLGWAYPRATWPGKKGTTATRVAPLVFSQQDRDHAGQTFRAKWQAGEALAKNLWGPSYAGPEQEAYSDATSGYRLVQYFDKGRMELTDPKGGTVTNGLLANELITGQIQVGSATFESRSPAAIPIAGDPDNPGPTYASFSGHAASLLAATPAKTGSAITATVSAAGDVTDGAVKDSHDVRTVATADTTLTVYDGTTKHNVPAAFAAYRAKVGTLVIGYAKSEPFVTTVKIGGVQRQVVVQVFERRVLTYNAANSDPFKVEMGNIGQHYDRWRYGK